MEKDVILQAILDIHGFNLFTNYVIRRPTSEALGKQREREREDICLDGYDVLRDQYSSTLQNSQVTRDAFVYVLHTYAFGFLSDNAYNTYSWILISTYLGTIYVHYCIVSGRFWLYSH